MMCSEKVVTPEKTGVQIFCKCSKNLDSGFRRNDEKAFLELLRVHANHTAFFLHEIPGDIVAVFG
jgi:hypothetical protein